MSVDAPVLTIGIPSYQSAAFIGEAISSALSQDFADLEVLVVDDASTDGTLDVVAGFDDPRLRVLRNEHNIGPGRNWNRVLEEARGRYVKIMGGDDVLLPGSLAAQVAVMEADPGVVLVTGSRLLVTEKGRRIMRQGNGGLRGHVAGPEATRAMVRQGANLVGEPCAALMRASAVGEAGPFDESEPYCIDMEMWLRLLAVGDLFVLERPVCGYRIVGTSWSTTVADSQYADVAALLRATAALGASESDLASGLRRAKRLAFGRRVLYRALFDVELRRKFLYLVIGGWNTLFGYLAFSLLYFLLHTVLSDTPILVLSYVPAILNAYFGYKKVVFRTDASFFREFPRFAIVYVIALVVNVVVFPWLRVSLGLNPYVSQAVFTVALVVCTYIVNKRFSFKQGAS
jgi:glycosyltransferase involved in cell wall biosynthesis